jgi:hypothetical protein
VERDEYRREQKLADMEAEYGHVAEQARDLRRSNELFRERCRVLRAGLIRVARDHLDLDAEQMKALADEALRREGELQKKHGQRVRESR